MEKVHNGHDRELNKQDTKPNIMIPIACVWG